PHMQIWHDTTGATDAEPKWVTTSSSWPPATQSSRLYLGSGAALAAAPPLGAEPADSYVSPTASAGTEDGVVFGQRNQLWKQPGTPGGALAYTTPRLAHAAELLGPASLDLWLKSTATDTNLQATITEVRPDGQEAYVARGWLRASQRCSRSTTCSARDLGSDWSSTPPARPAVGTSSRSPTRASTASCTTPSIPPRSSSAPSREPAPAPVTPGATRSSTNPAAQTPSPHPTPPAG
ncbi:MAG: hypothetical protein E6G05_15150, partial [Actinobacteria bacterium]